MPNKPAVKDTVKRMAAQAGRSLTPLTAIALDLDNFKEINDSFGHARGDDFLAAVGAALADTLRSSDFVGRNGGEEFVVLLPDTDTSGGLLVAEKIRAAISRLSVAGVDRQVTVSQGIATLPAHAGDSEGLLRVADRALYIAKTNGRDRCEVAVGSGGSDGEALAKRSSCDARE